MENKSSVAMDSSQSDMERQGSKKTFLSTLDQRKLHYNNWTEETLQSDNIADFPMSILNENKLEGNLG